jgi:hypothetical protein
VTAVTVVPLEKANPLDLPNGSALGDNHNAYPGGQNVSNLHLDGVVLKASLQIVDDGTWILQDGKWAL